jgi:3-oxoacyl-[acyl-carrier protein] reductase
MKILVTGASSKISQEIAAYFETKNHQVICSTSQKENLSKNQVFFDLSNPNSPDFETWLSAQKLDVLILNAATPTTAIKTTHKIPFKNASEFLKSNIEGNLYLLQKTLPLFVDNKFGRIIFISSQTVAHPLPGYSIYAAAKAALESIMRSISVEYGKYNITANTLRLGIIKTDRNLRFRERDGAEDSMVSKIALGRLGEPGDINVMIEALLSPTSYVTGTVIDVSGGLHIPR